MRERCITVVITCFNNSNYIKECITSVLIQRKVELEVIVIDDCSSDDSVDKIRGLLDGRPYCYLVQNQKNMGVAASRNKGLFEASAEFITFLDGDDFYANSLKLFWEVSLLNKMRISNRQNIIAFTRHMYSDSMGRPIHGTPLLPSFLYKKIFFLLRLVHLPRDFVCSTKLVKSIKGYDESCNLYEDWDYKVRLISKANFIMASTQFGSVYRKHPKGISRAPRLKLYQALTYYFKKNCDDKLYFFLLPIHTILFFLISPVSSAYYKLCGYFNWKTLKIDRRDIIK